MKLLVAILALAFAVGLSLLAQEADVPVGLSVAEQNAVNKKKEPNDRAKQYIKIADQKVEEARKATDRGDEQALEEALRGHEAAMKGAARAIEQGQSQGKDMSPAWETVNRATAKHTEVLRDLLTRVPEKAKPGIERAIAASQHGRETALQSIDKARQKRMAHGESGPAGQEKMKNRQGGGPPDISDREGLPGMGRAGGAGRPVGGPPSGAHPNRGRAGRP